ncbi:uroporphyrinogen-III C-methyltransferase [Aliidiomarina sanyensis]|uniref:Tetrapyrrole biosynthesis uroporphyrinogen III synthase domain-containing protein n=1 Tax=Aliidiomarina sanyensis TaxID=1249555 RepID=A0A432WG11_9GAMM|nr:uroporphyrinogen-III C-methyltransferase [Aliidiomarina sanyensis]RUO32657.1 hypothetical protein CWE11_07720 [Aliidiomarina sanyensis]
MTRPATLLIRPDQHADPIELALRDYGAPVYKFAVIEIEALTIDPDRLATWCETTWDGVIAVSPNAVRAFAKSLEAADADLTWPKAKTYYAVGSGTAEVLAAAAKQPVHYPATDFTSEGLLNLSEFTDCTAQKWLLLTGTEGRTLLRDTLQKHGAELTIAEVYQRVPRVNSLPDEEPAWQENVQVIVVSSVEQATLFWEHLSPAGRTWARRCHWVTPQGRVTRYIKEQGVSAEHIHAAENATPTSLIQAWKTIRKTAMTEKSKDHSKEVAERSKSETPERTEGATGSARRDTAKVPPAKLGWFARFFLFLIVLSVAVLGAGGYYVWQQQQAVSAETQARLDAMNERLADAERTTAPTHDWSEDIEALQTQMTRQFEAERRARERGLERLDTLRLDSEENLQQALDEYSRTTQRLAEEVRANGARQGEYRHLFEAYDLVTLAQQRLVLEFDKEGAIRILGLAKQRLEENAPGRFQTIIRQLNNDIDMLNELPTINVQAVALQLQQLQPRTRTLPFKAGFGESESTTSSQALSSDLSEWRQNLAKAWDNFSGDLIKVRRHDELPLRLDHDQRTLVLGQIEMALQIAQQAAMRHHQDLYRSTLNEVLEVVDTYLNTEHSDVRQFRAEVDALRGLPIEPDYPTRLLSHAMLRDRVEEVRNHQGE